MMMKNKFQLNIHWLTAAIALLLSTVLNIAFYDKLLQVYPFHNNAVFVLSVGFILFLVFLILVNIFRLKVLFTVSLFLLFPFVTTIAYSMNTYGTIYDDAMLINILQTSQYETLELLTPTYVLYVLIGFFIPLFINLKIKPTYSNFLKDLAVRAGIIAFSFLLIGLTVFSQSKQFASFFRVHKPIRYYVNPIHPLFTFSRYVVQQTQAKNQVFTTIGEDAKISSNGKKTLTIFIVGETARSNHFELNGYNRPTNPLLKQEDVLSFKNVFSCGTSTAHSVPCMFSDLGMESFDRDKAKWRSNLLDIINSTKEYKILWRDNNSSSKGVGDRIEYQDFQTNVLNTMSDKEGCRDEGMLVGLEEYIQNNKDQNIFIVLHQIGNHGPAYFKRYPSNFEKFTPICKTSQLDECSVESIVNTYDNALLYTDYFLAKTIALLKKYDDQFQTLMWYESDHGESLGENGIYLHSLPYSVAPKNQIHVPRILWLGKDLGHLKKQLNSSLEQEYSQDNIFHSILDVLNIKTQVLRPELSIFQKK